VTELDSERKVLKRQNAIMKERIVDYVHGGDVAGRT